MDASYSTITELPGEKIPNEQLSRISERYHWAAIHSKGKDVLECACGAGQGAKLLKYVSRNYIAGDFDQELVSISQKNNPDISFDNFDASNMPYKDAVFDVILVCEAIYYFPEIDKFLKEAKRVLRKNGKILIVSVNPNLFDFNPSPFTFNYLGVIGMGEYFSKHGFRYYSVEGGTDTLEVGVRQRFLRPIKFIASRLNLIPKTMKGKSWLKKIFFGGEFVRMPVSIVYSKNEPILVKSIDKNSNDKRHKVLYFIGEKK
jgi:ubiquinone/menaquinone biosynthesis C-methylase UbiE